MNKFSNLNKSLSKGFTLIELLIVIAVLGVLAAVVLVAVDPVEQLARGRDAGRKTTVAQIGRALQAFYTNNSAYPTLVQFTNVNATNRLVVSGDIRGIPTATVLPLGNPACTGGNLFGLGGNTTYCYKVDAVTANAVVYTKMESKAEINKGACVGPYAQVFYVYSTLDGRGGTVLLAVGAQPDAVTTYTYC